MEEPKKKPTQLIIESDSDSSSDSSSSSKSTSKTESTSSSITNSSTSTSSTSSSIPSTSSSNSLSDIEEEELKVSNGELENEFKGLNCQDEKLYSNECNKFLLKKELLERKYLKENENEEEDNNDESDNDESDNDDTNNNNLESDSESDNNDIKVVKLQISNEDNNHNEETNNLKFDVIEDLADLNGDFEPEINNTYSEEALNLKYDIEVKHLEENNIPSSSYLKTISINLGEEQSREDNIDYKKLQLAKLRSIVVEKNLISNSEASKLKKHELLKLLGLE